MFARGECAAARAVASFDQWGAFLADGALTATPWLSTRCHLPLSVARAQLRRGRALRSLPVAAEAFSAGQIGVAQVDALAQAASGPGPDTMAAFARDEALLVEQAKTMKFAPFRAVLSYWSQLAYPDGAHESDLERKGPPRRVPGPEHQRHVPGRHDPRSHLGGHRLQRAHPARTAALRGGLGEGQGRARPGPEDPRALPHPGPAPGRRPRRNGHAFGLVAPADAKRPEPLFSVLVGYETLHGRICQLQDGAVLSPDSLFSWLDRAEFERIVFAHHRVECSPRRGSSPGPPEGPSRCATSLCQHEYCEEPAECCQIDHIVPYSHGGVTEQGNGQCCAVCTIGAQRAAPARGPPDG